MKWLVKRRLLAALVTMVALACSAQAEEISWTYETSGPAAVYASGGTGGAIVFNYNPKDVVFGDSHVVFANLWTWSEAKSNNPDKYTNSPYTLSIYLQDNASKADTTLSFSGALSGVASKNSSLIDNTFVGSLQQAVTLGSNLFTVRLLGYVPPGPTSSSNAGAISALVQVAPKAAPEPTSLALGGLGLILAGLASWRTRRKSALVS